MLCKVFLLLLLRCGHGRFLRIFQVWPVNAPMWKAPSPGFLHQPCSAERLSTSLFRAWRLAYWQTHILEYVTPTYGPWSSSASITVANETPVEGTVPQCHRLGIYVKNYFHVLFLIQRQLALASHLALTSQRESGQA